MALDKVIDSAELDANLTTVADAIRTKGGTSEALSFPDGFISAVEGIQAGGGEDNSLLASILNKSCSTVHLPGVTSINIQKMFASNSNLISLSLPDLEYAADNLVQSCSNLEYLYVPELTSFSSFMLEGCSKIKNVRFPKVNTSSTNAVFRYCNSLETVDLAWDGGIGSWFRIGQHFFNSCSSLKALILRNTKHTWSLQATNAFTGSSIESGTGYIYVPRTLADGSDGVAKYQTATNWSTYANQIRAIEDYPDICGEVSA